MADDDPLGGAGSYSQLLFGDDDVVVSLGTDSDGCLNFSSSTSFMSAGNSPKMLCFGTKECHDLRSAGKVTCSEDSSSASSVTTARNHKPNVNVHIYVSISVRILVFKNLGFNLFFFWDFVCV